MANLWIIYRYGWFCFTNHSEKYEFVHWDDDIPNSWENKIHVPNHQPDYMEHMGYGSLDRGLKKCCVGCFMDGRSRNRDIMGIFWGAKGTEP